MRRQKPKKRKLFLPTLVKANGKYYRDMDEVYKVYGNLTRLKESNNFVVYKNIFFDNGKGFYMKPIKLVKIEIIDVVMLLHNYIWKIVGAKAENWKMTHGELIARFLKDNPELPIESWELTLETDYAALKARRRLYKYFPEIAQKLEIKSN